MDPSSFRRWAVGVLLAGATAFVAAALLRGGGSIVMGQTSPGGVVALPEPRADGALSVERALAQRRSLRQYRDEPLPLTAVSQLVWAAQGLTHPDGLRTAPSAGALYPLEVYVLAGRVMGLDPGLFHYETRSHRLERLLAGDLRVEVADAALGQDWMAGAPAVLLIAAVSARTARKYGSRADRYVHIEVGHAAQNVYLQAEALGLGTVIVGAFHDRRLREILALPRAVEPLALMPVGAPR